MACVLPSPLEGAEAVVLFSPAQPTRTASQRRRRRRGACGLGDGRGGRELSSDSEAGAGVGSLPSGDYGAASGTSETSFSAGDDSDEGGDDAGANTAGGLTAADVVDGDEPAMNYDLLGGHRIILDGGGVRDPGEDEIHLACVWDDVRMHVHFAARSGNDGPVAAAALAPLSMDPTLVPMPAVLAAAVGFCAGGGELLAMPAGTLIPLGELRPAGPT